MQAQVPGENISQVMMEYESVRGPASGQPRRELSEEPMVKELADGIAWQWEQDIHQDINYRLIVIHRRWSAL